MAIDDHLYDERDDGNPNSNPNSKIDAAFVIPPEHRPCRPHDSYLHCTDHIPVIDLAPLLQQHGSPEATEALVADVGRACEEWGFFQVINHGIPQALVQRLKEGALAFFDLPLQEKLQVKRTADNALGYNDGELTKNVRDWKEVFDIAVSGSLELPTDFEGDCHHTRIVYNQWPSNLPSLREVCEEYAHSAKKLAFTLLELISQSLGLPPHWFHELFVSGTTYLRLNHYPVCPAPELALGVSRHKDLGALTILLQDEVGGLQVRRKDGEWIGVQPDTAAPVVNVGDLIQVFSNDKYQSVEHRVVVNENSNRYSFPLFLNPAYWVNVSPIPELTDDQNPPRYTTINWGKFIKRRRDSNFKNLGVENLQIYHYAINRDKIAQSSE